MMAPEDGNQGRMPAGRSLLYLRGGRRLLEGPREGPCLLTLEKVLCSVQPSFKR